VTEQGLTTHVRGAVLVWASVTPDGRQATIERFQFADVLGLDAMVADLAEQRPQTWLHYVEARRRVSHDLFDLVAGGRKVLGE
jgi:hypothetical protein